MHIQTQHKNQVSKETLFTNFRKAILKDVECETGKRVGEGIVARGARVEDMKLGGHEVRSLHRCRCSSLAGVVALLIDGLE